MRKVVRIVFTAILSSLIQGEMLGQWVQTSGPGAGEVYSLAAKGRTIFAGTFRSGIFRSTNGGENWESVNSSLPSDAYVSSIAIADTFVFIATRGYGAFRSSDDGATWISLRDGSPHNVLSIVVHNNYLFLGTSFAGGIYRSSDNGVTWKT